LPSRFKRFFQSLRGAGAARTGPASTDGRLIYAIGDIHGRLDLLEPLIETITSDAAALDAGEKPILVFVGDYVDRGAASRAVIDVVIALKTGDRFEVRALKGNHEEAMLTFLADAHFGPTWCEHGGAETLASYGVPPPILRTDEAAWSAAQALFAQALPPAHLEFLRRLEMTTIQGDYLFVHAGLRPGVRIEDQDDHDLLWIRDDFIGSAKDARRRVAKNPPFEKIVVHGHTPEERVFIGDHRIGVDTGAYATGVLSAIRLLGPERTVIQAKAM